MRRVIGIDTHRTFGEVVIWEDGRLRHVEAAWAAAKTPGPLHAFFVRIRARRGHQVAAVAVARKLTVLVWHMLTKQEDYLWARSSLVAHKMRSMELQAGKPQKKATAAVRPMLTMSRNFETRRCGSPSRPRRVTNTSSRLGACARQRKGRAGASVRQGSNKAARRRFQPMHHASARGRPRTTTIADCVAYFQLRQPREAPCTPDRRSMPPYSGRSRPKPCGGRVKRGQP